jgi:hypothetical protein
MITVLGFVPTSLSLAFRFLLAPSYSLGMRTECHTVIYSRIAFENLMDWLIGGRGFLFRYFTCIQRTGEKLSGVEHCCGAQ